ncbi:MAG: methyl-accepting chemotaxis protein [Propionivibrio sp.]
MLRKFHNLSIGTKLNVLLTLAAALVIAVATTWLAVSVHQQVDSQALTDLQRTNQLAVAMFETTSHSLSNDVERSGRLFAGRFNGAIAYQASGERPQLTIDGEVISEGDEATRRIDAFSADSNTVATIFVRRGDDFLRTATSLKDEKGARTTGTLLAASHPAIALLKAGKPYTGKAVLFGREYFTHYLPVKDQAGQVIGCFFVGLDMTETLKALKKEIGLIKVGTTGYVYALDVAGQGAVMTIHPSIEGKDVLATTDSDGKKIFVEMVERKNGVIRYNWANPGEPKPRAKVAVFTHVPEWDWVVASGSYLDELTTIADTVTAAIIVMAVCILLAITAVCYFLVHRWVTRPLAAVVAETQRFASGDLDVRLRVASNDEVGRLIQAISSMADALKKVIGDTRRASATMLDQALQLVSAAGQVSTSSQAQSDAAASMAASVEEMSVSIGQVAQHASDAREISTRSGESAAQGAHVIEKAGVAMEKIADTVRAAAAKIGELGEHAQNISSVVAVIREIADQTNLLALNAAIEAARAGEQGRGFAVVADEVRKLAERTTSSTQSIVERINSIQSGTRQAIDCMQDGVTQVEQGSALAADAGAAIAHIDQSARAVIDAVASIANAIDEQSQATQSIAQSVEAVASKAEENNFAAQSSAASAQALRDLATALDGNLGFFRGG